MKFIAIVTIWLALGIGQVQAQGGDAAIGGQLAQRWCTGCHVIAGSGYSQAGAPALPPKSARDQKWLRAWLASPHPPMPDPQLSRPEIDDIVAYLDSLPRS